MKKIIIFLLFMTILAGCGVIKTDQTIDDSKLQIKASSYPLQYIAEQIGGNLVHVESILPPGTDAHTYEPTAKEIVEIAKSDLFLYTGASMEPYAQTIAKSLEQEDVLLVSLDYAEAVFRDTDPHSPDEELHSKEDSHLHEAIDNEQNETEHEHEHEHISDGHDGHNHGDQDPHFWIDPMRMIIASEHIKTEFIHHFPEHADTFRSNFEKLKNDLEELNTSFSNMVENKTSKTIFVSHAAFGYWEEQYGIEQLSIRGLSTTNEPSQKELSELVDQVEDLNLTYVILEQNQSDSIAELLANELNLETLYIHNLSSLSENEIETGADYISIMNQNIETLDKALGR